MRKWWIVRAPNGYLCNWCILVYRTKNTKTEPKRYLCETTMSCSEWVRTDNLEAVVSKCTLFHYLRNTVGIVMEQTLVLWEHFKKGLCRYTVVVVVVIIIIIIIIITNNYYYFYYYGACFTAGMSMPEISVPSYISGRKKLPQNLRTLPRILVDPGKTVPWSAPSLFQHLCFSGRPSVSSE